MTSSSLRKHKNPPIKTGFLPPLNQSSCVTLFQAIFKMSSAKSESASSIPQGGAAASAFDEVDAPIRQLVVNGKYLSEHLSKAEREALFQAKECANSALNRKTLKMSIERSTLNHLKMARSALLWGNICQSAAAADTDEWRLSTLKAIRKGMKHWEAIEASCGEIMKDPDSRQKSAESSSDLSDDEEEEFENMPFREISKTGKRKRSTEDCDSVTSDEQSQMEGDEEEDEDEEEAETGTAPKIKQKSKTEKAPPKKKPRQSKKKEYVIPENKMVSIGALRSPKDAFVIMDISDTKKIHFGNDPVSSMLIFMTMLIIL